MCNRFSQLADSEDECVACVPEVSEVHFQFLVRRRVAKATRTEG